ncbi:hypothetical protein MRBLMR1_001648 [Neorhizobium sp. LMR1-1-1.1]
MNPELMSLIAAFDRLAAAGFKVGPEWEDVHNLCQQHEGEQAFDWGHALCHRIEGDDWNADYWYRRAGRRRIGAISEEWTAMKAALSAA